MYFPLRTAHFRPPRRDDPLLGGVDESTRIDDGARRQNVKKKKKKEPLKRRSRSMAIANEARTRGNHTTTVLRPMLATRPQDEN